MYMNDRCLFNIYVNCFKRFNSAISENTDLTARDRVTVENVANLSINSVSTLSYGLSTWYMHVERVEHYLISMALKTVHTYA